MKTQSRNTAKTVGKQTVCRWSRHAEQEVSWVWWLGFTDDMYLIRCGEHCPDGPCAMMAAKVNRWCVVWLVVASEAQLDHVAKVDALGLISCGERSPVESCNMVMTKANRWCGVLSGAVSIVLEADHIYKVMAKVKVICFLRCVEHQPRDGPHVWDNC